MRKACRISDMPRSDSEVLSASPMPLSSRTPPNMPPAPVIRMIEQIGPSALSRIVLTSAIERSRRPSTKIAARVVISSATVVSPSSISASAQVAPSSITPAVMSVASTVLKEISTSGSSSRPRTVPKAGGVRVACVAAASRPPSVAAPTRPSRPSFISPNRASGMSTWIRLPRNRETRQHADVPGHDRDRDADEQGQSDVGLERLGGRDRAGVRRDQRVHRGEGAGGRAARRAAASRRSGGRPSG